jgi:hypothetical protein
MNFTYPEAIRRLADTRNVADLLTRGSAEQEIARASCRLERAEDQRAAVGSCGRLVTIAASN